jgi:hypothetical protein
MKTGKEIKNEWYEMLFSFPQLKDITDDEKNTLTAYFNDINYFAWELKDHILKRLEKIIWELVWGLDEIQVDFLINVLQETSVAIWILNDKKLPDQKWLINNYLDYWIENPNRMCEPLNTTDTNGNFHEAIGNAGQRFINKYALWAIDKMKNETIN